MPSAKRLYILFSVRSQRWWEGKEQVHHVAVLFVAWTEDLNLKPCSCSVII
jgi:hypothetical protein